MPLISLNFLIRINKKGVFIKEFKQKEDEEILKELIKNILIISLVFILLKVSYSKFIEKEYPIKLFGFAFLVVTTGSMEPEINAGELIIIKEVDRYEMGDIVTFVDKDDFLVTHRIVCLNEKNMITKGDNNNVLDEETNLNNIKGKVISHSEILGFFVLYLLKPLVFMYMITLVILNIIRSFCNEEREDKTNEENKIEINIDN